MAHFHGVERDGITFGMEVSLSSECGKKFKKKVHREYIVGFFGEKFEGYVCEAPFVASLMGAAGWLVTEGYIYKFTIDSFLDGEEIFIKQGEKISFSEKGAIEHKTG